MNVFVKKQGTENWLRDRWRAWSQKYPQRAAAYLAEIVRIRQNLRAESGLSREGTLAYEGTIPEDLFVVLWIENPDFFMCPANLQIAYRVFMGEDNMPSTKDHSFHFIEKPPQCPTNTSP